MKKVPYFVHFSLDFDNVRVRRCPEKLSYRVFVSSLEIGGVKAIYYYLVA